MKRESNQAIDNLSIFFTAYNVKSVLVTQSKITISDVVEGSSVSKCKFKLVGKSIKHKVAQ